MPEIITTLEGLHCDWTRPSNHCDELVEAGVFVRINRRWQFTLPEMARALRQQTSRSSEASVNLSPEMAAAKGIGLPVEEILAGLSNTQLNTGVEWK